MSLLAYGDTGWGDELFFATLMTIAVAAAAIFEYGMWSQMATRLWAI